MEKNLMNRKKDSSMKCHYECLCPMFISCWYSSVPNKKTIINWQQYQITKSPVEFLLLVSDTVCHYQLVVSATCLKAALTHWPLF